MKPSRARVPHGPVRGEGLGYFMHHALSLSVRDNAALLDVVTAEDRGSAYRAPLPGRPFLSEVGEYPGRLRIAVIPEFEDLELSEDARVATAKAAALCKDLGHAIEYIKLPVKPREMRRLHNVLSAANIHARIASFERASGCIVGPADVDKLTWLTYQAGRQVSGVALLSALSEIQIITRKLASYFENYDLVMTPAVGRAPFKIGAFKELGDDLDAIRELQIRSFPITSLFNHTGSPAMSVPLYWNKDNLPLGTQFAAAWGREDLLFRLAGQLEAAEPWFDKRPPIS